MRFRHVYTFLLSALIVLAMFLADPDNGFIQNLKYGAGTVAFILVTLRATLYVSLLHVSRRALFDYVRMGALLRAAEEGNIAASLIFVGITLAMIAIAIVIAAAV